ncbi:uncharacterized protein BXZ73DRAFT_92098 [Epithele typhae]|uniref:uncharacterized protein n=1 Tax=Epithele typhae TaxID=378194 RepID=UPI002007AE1B|nr:uncharacterized protein BXZ73DRAFT_92098 [Epithele typhae]KAH9919156.1 hypothetical protein BXZ73DRAFT_92098 [Epithele typhae]
MWCNQTLQVLQDSSLAAAICSVSESSEQCTAICPNPDLSGIGVRVAFYLQSFLNTLLVIFSRTDSVPSTWAATLLTGALVIAAIVQKVNGTITLHHAILTMNFATISCIGSLAVAPTLSIWRLTPKEYYKQQLSRDVLEDDDADAQQRMIGQAVEEITVRHRKRIARAQSRQRVILALALLTQVVLQWAWGIVLFVSPSYSQRNCSGETRLVFFVAATFTAQDLNDHMGIWVTWLLFSLGITMFMTIMLALSSPTRARPSPASSIATFRSTSTGPTHTPVYRQVLEGVWRSIPTWHDKSAQKIFWYNVLSVFLWLAYIIATERQIQENCLFQGENVISSFGQITALLLSLAPIWSLTVALYKWPALQRRLERQRRRELLRRHSLPTIVLPITTVAAPGFGAPDIGLDQGHLSPHASPDCDGDGGASSARTSTSDLSAAPSSPPGVVIPPPTGTVGAHGDRERARAPRRRGPRRRHAVAPTLDVVLPRTPTFEWREMETFPGPSR